MLKCIVVSTSGTKFSALAFKENIKDSIAKVAALGFDAVELAVRDPNLINFEELNEILRGFNLPVPAIGTGQAYGEEGLSFTNSNPAVRKKAVQRIKDQMDFSNKLCKPQVIIGLIRGTVEPGMDRELAEGHFIECMQECADYRREIILTLEPINRYETNLYNDTTSMIEVINKIGRRNVKMLFDTFHMNIEEPDMIKAIHSSKDYISHVHFADSNRWAPGCGHIDFKEIIAALREINYHEAVSAEILPKPTPDDSARLTMDFFKKSGL
ncbi:MAG: 5-keto-L-gluconate epimerase [Bacillota bacterium]